LSQVVSRNDIAEILLKVALKHQKIKSKADYINNHILNVLKYIFDIQLIIKLQSDFLNTIILINYNPSCMYVRYSTPHVHYPQLNPSRVCLPTNFQKFKYHIFYLCLCVCQYL
jgi:hypothetical protein